MATTSSPLVRQRRVRVSLDLVESVLQQGTPAVVPQTPMAEDIRIIGVAPFMPEHFVELLIESAAFAPVDPLNVPLWTPMFNREDGGS